MTGSLTSSPRSRCFAVRFQYDHCGRLRLLNGMNGQEKNIEIRQSTSRKSFAFLGNVLYFVGISLHPAQSKYCNPFIFSGRLVVVFGILLDIFAFHRCLATASCYFKDVVHRSRPRILMGSWCDSLKCVLAALKYMFVIERGRPHHIHVCSCFLYQSWLVSIHLYTVISVDHSKDGHNVAQNCCMSLS